MKEKVKKCPFCGKKADVWHEFDVKRAGCSDHNCPAAFGDDGIDFDFWQARSKNCLLYTDAEESCQALKDRKAELVKTE